ncbi:unnamed protein product [Durusdinium trenchii]|uniref:Secreted protein n=1 Tax=Durusdinium trenchii TaxID=1381693 RepID=A0ABP0M684_9DINO
MHVVIVLEVLCALVLWHLRLSGGGIPTGFRVPDTISSIATLPLVVRWGRVSQGAVQASNAHHRETPRDLVEDGHGIVLQVAPEESNPHPVLRRRRRTEVKRILDSSSRTSSRLS